MSEYNAKHPLKSSKSKQDSSCFEEKAKRTKIKVKEKENIKAQEAKTVKKKISGIKNPTAIIPNISIPLTVRFLLIEYPQKSLYLILNYLSEQDLG